MTAKPLMYHHCQADFGTAERKDGGKEPMIFLTLHAHSGGTVEALPTVWIAPANMTRLIAALQEAQALAAGRAHPIPPGPAH